MPRKPSGKPSGPPPKEVNLDQVLYWIDMQATAEEIAGSFHVSIDTLQRRLKAAYGIGFAELRSKCDGLGKLSLRRNQFNLSKKSAAMAIFLGKQWLGQKDDKVIVNMPESWPFMDQTKNPLNVKDAINTRNDKSIIEPILANEQPISHQRQAREKSSL